MTQMTETAADRLTPDRAAELARVLDLQAKWENLRADGNDSTARLQALQRAFEEYRVRLTAYSARDRSEPIPELSPTGPGRLGTWCRTVRAVLRRAAGADGPLHIVAKAHRLADRIAARGSAAVAGRETPADLAGAIRQLDLVIAWCDELAAAPRPPAAEATYEVGSPAGVA